MNQTFREPTNQQMLIWPDADVGNFMWDVDRENSDCPFSRIVGNDNAVTVLQDIAFEAFFRTNHLPGKTRVVMTGPDSNSKRDLARAFAETLGLPFVDVKAESVRYLNDILVAISAVCEATIAPLDDGFYTTLELVPMWKQGAEDPCFIIPPLVLFIDDISQMEARFLAALLSAAHGNDLITEPGWVSDCKRACMMLGSSGTLPLLDVLEVK